MRKITKEEVSVGVAIMGFIGLLVTIIMAFILTWVEGWPPVIIKTGVSGILLFIVAWILGDLLEDEPTPPIKPVR